MRIALLLLIGVILAVPMAGALIWANADRRKHKDGADWSTG